MEEKKPFMTRFAESLYNMEQRQQEDIKSLSVFIKKISEFVPTYIIMSIFVFPVLTAFIYWSFQLQVQLSYIEIYKVIFFYYNILVLSGAVLISFKYYDKFTEKKNE